MKTVVITASVSHSLSPWMLQQNSTYFFLFIIAAIKKRKKSLDIYLHILQKKTQKSIFLSFGPLQLTEATWLFGTQLTMLTGLMELTAGANGSCGWTKEEKKHLNNVQKQIIHLHVKQRLIPMTVSLVRIYKSQVFIKATGRSCLIFNLYYIYDNYF